ncbi:MFS transporter [Pseudofulvibacter geojedonensis]|uniref:MFS transporter n=1 Tax=Pseudofulvibacter geojedonensis TaxID=1123758 RepID=A0ABW3HY89_9FLAO
MTKFIKGSKKVLNAWAFYDWANSVYNLTIVSALFPIFYGALFLKGEAIDFLFLENKSYDIVLIYVTAFGYLVVSIISPILSGIADYTGNKKLFLRLFCYIGSISSMMLYFFSKDNLELSFLFYAIALIGFWGSLVFYNSYLPDIAYPEQQDAISAKGFSMGYIGSVVLLVFNLALVMFPQSFGIKGDTAGEMKMQAMRISFLTVGIWWFGFSHYSYKYLPNLKTGKKVTSEVLVNGFRELSKVWKSFTESMQLKRFIIAFFVYSMAVQTVMTVATIFGEKEINWGDEDNKSTGLIVSILLIQLVAVLGAQLTSKLSSKIGNVKTLILINGIWIGLCCYAFFVYSPFQFYIAAAGVGMVMGGVQALSRSTYSKFLPETTDTTSYFSFYDVTEKCAMVIGLFLYGFIGDMTGSSRNSILALIFFFIIGLILLFRVPKKNE